ncbi:MAG TPA: GNAT family N-acetyltransferase [Puia sp.]|nr:GNAT family N-acetyltransferase [Puia sp.]
MTDANLWTRDEFQISTDPLKLDVAYIHDFLSKRSYWAEHIPMETVRRSIAGSLNFAIYHREKQVGFARVITDWATFGYLADVFIDEGYRGRGLSVWMMEIIMSHPRLQGFRNWQLATRDAHGLYEKFGFRKMDNPDRIMRKNDPDIYTRKKEKE